MSLHERSRRKGKEMRTPRPGLSAPENPGLSEIPTPTTPDAFTDLARRSLALHDAATAHDYLGSEDRFAEALTDVGKAMQDPSDTRRPMEIARENAAIIKGADHDAPVFQDIAEQLRTEAALIDRTLLDAAHLLPQAKARISEDIETLDWLEHAAQEHSAYKDAVPPLEVIEDTKWKGQVLDLISTVNPALQQPPDISPAPFDTEPVDKPRAVADPTVGIVSDSNIDTTPTTAEPVDVCITAPSEPGEETVKSSAVDVSSPAQGETSGTTEKAEFTYSDRTLRFDVATGVIISTTGETSEELKVSGTVNRKVFLFLLDREDRDVSTAALQDFLVTEKITTPSYVVAANVKKSIKELGASDPIVLTPRSHPEGKFAINARHIEIVREDSQETIIERKADAIDRATGKTPDSDTTADTTDITQSDLHKTLPGEPTASDIIKVGDINVTDVLVETPSDIPHPEQNMRITDLSGEKPSDAADAPFEKAPYDPEAPHDGRILRENPETGIIHLANGIKVGPDDLSQRYRMLLLGIPDQGDFEAILAPRTLASKFSRLYDTPDDQNYVHGLKSKSEESLARFGIAIRYDEDKGGYYRTLIQPRRSLQQVTEGQPKAKVKEKDISTKVNRQEHTEAVYDKLSQVDISYLAGVLADSQIRSKFVDIDGIIEEDALTSLVESVDTTNLDHVVRTLGALDKVNGMIERDREAYDELAGHLLDEGLESVAELLLAYGDLRDTKVRTGMTNGEPLNGLQYLTLASANRDVDVAVRIVETPDALLESAASTPVDLQPGEDATLPAGASRAGVETSRARPLERRDPEVRDRLGEYFTQIGEKDLKLDDITSETVQSLFGGLTKRHIAGYIKDGFIKPTYRGPVPYFTTSDIAAMLYLKNAPTERMTIGMKKDVARVAQEVYDDSAKQQIIDARKARREASE